MIELSFEQYPSQVADVLTNAANDTGMIVIGTNDTRLIYDMLLLEEENSEMYSVEEWACGILVGNHSKNCLNEDETANHIVKRDLEKRAASVICSTANAVTVSVCESLLNYLGKNTNVVIQTSPRSVCKGDCCASWSKKVNSFTIGGLGYYSELCENACDDNSDDHKWSCEVYGANVNSVALDVCVSNRPNGCT